jgi:type I restriction enzyme S subunit
MDEVADFITKGTTPTTLGFEFQKSGINFIKIESITTDGRFLMHKMAHIDEACDLALSRSRLQEGDILFSIAGALGRSAIVTPAILPANINQALAIIRLKPRVDVFPLFVLKALSIELVASQIEENRGGAAQENLSLAQIKRFKIPLPPLPEQQRIVAILDEAFAGIAKATANAERNIENAEDLVEAQREGLISAAVPEAEKFTLQELLERAWIVGHLDGNHGADYPRKEEFVGSGVAYISANALSGDAVDFGRAKFLTTDRAARIRKGVARHGDVLFAHNATVGPVAVLSTDLDRVILGTSLTYYRCDQQHILPAYLAHFMRSARFRQQYEAVMRQSTRNQVPITKQREFFHLIPPLAVQESIAGTLDEYEMQAAALRAVYRQKLAALSELRASLLHRAFSGQLTDASAVAA